MKKGLAVTLGAALCFGQALTCIPMPIAAEEAAQLNAAGFVDQYLKIAKTTSANGQTAAVNTFWIRVADASNASWLLEGYEIFQTLPASVQQEILALYKEGTKVDYKQLIDQATRILEEAASKEEADKASVAEQASKTETPQAPAAQETAPVTEAAKKETVVQETAVQETAVKDTGNKENKETEKNSKEPTAETPASQMEKASQASKAAASEESLPAFQDASAPAQPAFSEDKTAGPAAQSPAAQEEQPEPAPAQETTAAKSSAAGALQPYADGNPVRNPLQRGQGLTGSSLLLKAPDSLKEETSRDETSKDETSNDASKDDPAEDEASVETPEADPTVDDENVLFTGSLSVNSQGHKETIALQVKGEPAVLDPIQSEAVDTFLVRRGITDATLYENVLYTATHEDNQAASKPMYAALQPDGSLLLFTMEAKEGKMEFISYSLEAISFDFSTGTLTPIVQGTFSCPLPEDSSKPDTPDTPQPEDPQDPPAPGRDPSEDLPQSPDTPANPQDPVYGNDIEVLVPDPSKETLTVPAPVASDTIDGPVTMPPVHTSQSPVQPASPTQSPAPVTYTQQAYSAQAQNFVWTYCSNSAGQIYLYATAGNYRQILNGYNSWRKLSATARSEVNAILQNSAKTTYATLFSGANRIRLGLSGGTGSAATTPSVSINASTSASSQAGWHIFAMMMSSLGFLVSLLRKKDII